MKIEGEKLYKKRSKNKRENSERKILQGAKERTRRSTRDKEDHRASFGFRSSSPWVFLRVRPWIDSLSRTIVSDGSWSYTTWRTRANPLAFDDNDTLEPRVTRPVGDESREKEEVSKGA